jgi:hypothetical protein
MMQDAVEHGGGESWVIAEGVIPMRTFLAPSNISPLSNNSCCENRYGTVSDATRHYNVH